MKLKSILKQQPMELLERILEFWKLQTPAYKMGATEEERRQKLIDHLYPRMQMPQYFGPAYDKVSNAEKEFIAFLVIHGGDLTREEVLSRQFQGSEDTYKPMLEGLSLKGFMFEDDLSDEEVGAILVGVPEPFIRYIDLPSYWSGYLGYFLRDLTTSQLKSMANTRLGIAIESSKKNYLISRIREYLTNPKKLREYIRSLPDAERNVFEQIVARKGVCIYRELLETGNQRRYDHARAESINNLLNNTGLLFVASEGDTKHNHLIMVPRDIQYMVTHDYRADGRSLNDLDTVSIIARDKQPNVVLDNSNSLLRDLTIFAAWINNNMVRTLANGAIGKNDLKKILPLLSANKTLKYAVFLELFLISQKFIISVGDVWRVSNTFSRWLEDSKACYRDVFRFWLETNEWNEEYIEGDTVHAEAYPANLVNITELRKVVLKQLSSTPAERWLRFPAWVETVLPAIDAALPKRSSSTTIDRFNRSSPQILESIVGECMHWLGITSLGLTDMKLVETIGNRGAESTEKIPPGRPRQAAKQGTDFAFQITPLGRAVLESNLSEPEKLFDGQDTDHLMTLRHNIEQFTVLPSLEIITPPDLRLRSFYSINEFAEIKMLDVMSTFVLTRESVRKGMDNGVRAEDILRFLTEGSLTPLPETIKHLIHECSSKHGEVRLGFSGGYLIVEDPIRLQEIRNNKRLTSSIKDVIGDSVILLNSDVDIKKLGKLLYKMGYMPNIDSENVHVTQEGAYHLTFSNEELYNLMATLRYIIELEEELGTPSASDDVRAILERLKPDAQAYYELNFFAENISKRYARKFSQALKKRLDDATAKYKKQVSKLIANQPRSTTKYEFDGPNPAETEEDITAMVDFALDHDMELDIVYLRANQEEVQERIEPETFSGGKLYAFNPKRDSYSVYRLNRIKSCSLP